MQRDERYAILQRDRDSWREAHRELATALNATARGRDHVDAMLVVAALRRAFYITDIKVAPDATYVEVTTDDGVVHRVPTCEEI